jgi:carbonic anhydrase/acetyltransferase-like protein (isoleucine patch superfamily)
MTRLGDGRDGVVPFGRHRPVIAPGVFVAPGTWIIGEVTIAAGASVWFGAVLRGDAGPIVIGPGTLVEDNVVLHGAVTTGEGVVLGHGAVVHDSTIAARAVIGSNATLFGATVGEGAIVAIGSVVNPHTVVPPSTVFRNGPHANDPSLAPVRSHPDKWAASYYDRLIRIYRGEEDV